MSELLVAEIKNAAGNPIALLPLPEKSFKTGSKGYYANSKITIGEKRYQVQIQLVEIGSKNKSEET